MLPDDTRTLSLSDTHAVICVVHIDGGSQVSPRLASIRPLPHPAQSLSVVGPQVTLVGQ